MEMLLLLGLSLQSVPELRTVQLTDCSLVKLITKYLLLEPAEEQSLSNL